MADSRMMALAIIAARIVGGDAMGYERWTKDELIDEIDRFLDAMLDAVESLEADEAEEALDLLCDALGILPSEAEDEGEAENPDAV